MNKEKEIKNTIGKFTASMITAIESFEGERLTADEVIRLNNVCGTLVRRFAAVEPKNRYFFHFKWEYILNERDYGFGYLSHYITRLFIELAKKRYEPVNKKDMSYVMKQAHNIKKIEGKDLGAAMTKVYKYIDRAGALRSDSISEECKMISDACLLDVWNSLMPNYPELCKGVDGRYNIGKPKAKAVQLVADILGPLTVMIGYGR